MNRRRLTTALDALLSFAEKIGVSEEQLSAGESVSEITYFEESYPTTAIQSLDLSTLNEVRKAFGQAFTGSIRIGEMRVLGFDSANDGEFQQFRQDVVGKQTVTLHFRLDKQKLLDSWELGSFAQRRVVAYLFSSSFLRLLKVALSQPSVLEESVWESRDSGKAVVLLADEEIDLDGPLFCVIGGKSIDQIDQITGASTDLIDRVASEYESCRTAVRWEKEWLSFLTPRHLEISWPEAQSNQILTAIAGVAANVAFLYSADRVRQDETSWVSTFATDHTRSHVRAVAAADVDEQSIDVEGAFAVRDMASWAYDNQWQSDRVRMLQVSVARALVGGGDHHAEELLARASAVRDDLQWHWKTFISDEIDRYVEEERDLENEVAQTVDTYESQVADMIKSLSGTMLAAVGVLIGSFIAAAFKDKFNDRVFVLGIVSYMVYLAGFPGIYNMTHHFIRFRAHDNMFRKRKKRLARILGDEVTTRVIGDDIRNARSRFWNWFKFTSVTLIAVLILAGFAAAFVPRLLKVQPATAPPPVVSPQP